MYVPARNVIAVRMVYALAFLVVLLTAAAYTLPGELISDTDCIDIGWSAYNAYKDGQTYGADYSEFYPCMHEVRDRREALSDVILSLVPLLLIATIVAWGLLTYFRGSRNPVLLEAPFVPAKRGSAHRYVIIST